MNQSELEEKRNLSQVRETQVPIATTASDKVGRGRPSYVTYLNRASKDFVKV